MCDISYYRPEKNKPCLTSLAISRSLPSDNNYQTHAQTSGSKQQLK